MTKTAVGISLYYWMLWSYPHVEAFLSQGSAPFVAFVPTKTTTTPAVIASRPLFSPALEMAGFGGSGGGGMSKKGGKKKKSTTTNVMAKLKPKAQWDRYIKMKHTSGIRVGVRVNNSNNGDEKKEVGQWLEIGKIKCENNELVEAAVAVQRALIAEVSKEGIRESKDL